VLLVALGLWFATSPLPPEVEAQAVRASLAWFLALALLLCWVGGVAIAGGKLWLARRRASLRHSPPA